MKNKIWEIRDSVERQLVRLERAHAVHSEAGEYFDTKEHRDLLSYSSERVSLLLDVVGELMLEIKSELIDTVELLSELKESNDPKVGAVEL